MCTNHHVIKRDQNLNAETSALPKVPQDVTNPAGEGATTPSQVDASVTAESSLPVPPSLENSDASNENSAPVTALAEPTSLPSLPASPESSPYHPPYHRLSQK